MRNEKFFFRYLTLFFVLILTPLFYFNYLKSQVDPKGKMKAFVIQRGESISQIADRLQKEGFIRSEIVFKIALRLSGDGRQIVAGDFKLSSAMNLDEVIKNLKLGPVDRWVTLIEGLRVEEVAKKLNEELGVKSEDFVMVAKKHEGYLFPDTYLFNSEASLEDIVSILRNNFNKKYDDSLKTKVKRLGLTDLGTVILASVVEREARSDQARKMVASILLKRLRIGMKLDADATVQYALNFQPQEKSWWKRHLTKEDLKTDSPYNTYTNPGLPPTPICNPSLSSLKAVANADVSTPYLYYYHDSQGKSHYAETLDEHNENVANNP